MVGIVGLIGYGVWERASAQPMTPPRLAKNRLFVGLNIATVPIYAGLSIMFFLLPFDLLDHRGLAPMSAGLTFLPFTLGVGFLSAWFGRVADAIAPPGNARRRTLWCGRRIYLDGVRPGCLVDGGRDRPIGAAWRTASGADDLPRVSRAIWAAPRDAD